METMRRLTNVAFAFATLAVATPAHAQTFPSKPVSIIVTSAPGGAADATARMLALHLGKSWNQQVIVENKPGGNTQIAAEYVAKAPPDGHTLLLGPDVHRQPASLSQAQLRSGEGFRADHRAHGAASGAGDASLGSGQ
jgi:tripartite-type tricarboxylate transporter receptor subunit TctC